MNIICAVDRQWAIGNKGDLLFKIPSDLKRFKELTESNVIVMGRKTMDSLPNSKPLENRINIVLTKNTTYKKEGAIVLNSMEELFKRVEKYKYEGKDVFLIGGGEVINELIDNVDTAYITKINREAKEWDVKIPNLDLKKDWILCDVSDTNEYKGTLYRYNIYRRV